MGLCQGKEKDLSKYSEDNKKTNLNHNQKKTEYDTRKPNFEKEN